MPKRIVASAALLQLNLLSFAALHFLSHPGNPSPGVVLYLALFAWFLCDYLVFERVPWRIVPRIY